MKKVVKKQEVIEKEAKTEEDPDDFKEELKHDLEKRRKPLVWVLFVIILLIFGSLGIGAYQIFLKPAKIEESQDNTNKIQNRPSDDQAQSQPAQTPVPANTAPAPTTTSAPMAYTEYTVQEGDTWSSIANDHSMTSAKLMEYNGTTSEDLQIGQKIKIPKS